MPDEAPAAPPTADPRLLERLQEAAEPDGFVPFDRFMEVALYGDGVGYYQRGPSPFGAAGDFYTAAHVTPLFGAAFAERVREVRRHLAPGRPFHLVELGPGDGPLLRDCLERLGRSPADLRDLEVTLVERSASRESVAAAAVAPVTHSLGLPLRREESVAALGPFEGVVIANELLDAQPVRRFRRRAGGWEELGVRVEGGRLASATQPSSGQVAGPPLPSATEEGGVVEISPRAEGLVREVADHLVHGAFLLDDYGMDEAELLRAHPHGTLTAVRSHQARADVLGSPGSTDLSAFVNFSRLRTAALSGGLTLLEDRRQSDALAAWGFEELFAEAVQHSPSAEAEVRQRLAVKNLLFGFERFRVLEFVPDADRDRWHPAT